MKVIILAVFLTVVACVSGSAIHYQAQNYPDNEFKHQSPVAPNFGFDNQGSAQPNFGFYPEYQQQPNFGFQQQAPAQPNFGFNNQSPAKPSIGHPNQQQPNSQQQPNFGFNQQAPAQPNFGFHHESQQQPNLEFNQQVPAQPNFGFHHESQQQPNFGFNHQAPAQTNFGWNNQSPAKPSFGHPNQQQPNSQQQPNFGFNQQAPAQPNFGFPHESQQQPNFGFNHQAPAQPNFGWNNQSPSKPSFGHPTQQQPNSQQQPNFGFNHQAPAQPNFGLNNQSPAKPSFGYPHQQQHDFGHSPQVTWQPNYGYNPQNPGKPNYGPKNQVQVKPLEGPVSQNHVASQEEDDDNLGTLLQAYYSAIKTLLHCGYAPWNVPSFSPFKLDHHEFDLETDDFELKGNVSNLVFSGLDDFTFLDLNYDEETGIFSMDYIFPEIQLLGECDIESMVKIAGFPVHTSGKGVLNMKWEDLRFVGSFKLIPLKGKHGLEVSDFHARTYLADVEVNNWNDLWDIATNNFVNKMMRENLIMLQQQSQEFHEVIYAKYALPAFNKLLVNVNMDQLVDGLKQITNELNEHNEVIGNCKNQN